MKRGFPSVAADWALFCSDPASPWHKMTTDEREALKHKFDGLTLEQADELLQDIKHKKRHQMNETQLLDEFMKVLDSAPFNVITNYLAIPEEVMTPELTEVFKKTITSKGFQVETQEAIGAVLFKVYK